MIFDIHRVRRELTNLKVGVMYCMMPDIGINYLHCLLSALKSDLLQFFYFFKAAKSDAYISFTLHWKAVSL